MPRGAYPEGLTVRHHITRPDLDPGPTASDLATLVAEEPLIEAGIALVDAEIRLLLAGRAPTELDWQRLRRAQRNVLRAAVQVAAAGHDRQPGRARRVA